MNTEAQAHSNNQTSGIVTTPITRDIAPKHVSAGMYEEVLLNDLGLDKDGTPLLKTVDLIAALTAARTIKELEMAVGMRFGECTFEMRQDGTFLRLPKRDDKIGIFESLSNISKWLLAKEAHSTRPSESTHSALNDIENEIGDKNIRCLRNAANEIALACRKEIVVGINGNHFTLTVPHRSILESPGDTNEINAMNRSEDIEPVVAIRDAMELISTTGQAFLVDMSPLISRLEPGCIVALRPRTFQSSFRLVDDPQKERIDGTE